MMYSEEFVKDIIATTAMCTVINLNEVEEEIEKLPEEFREEFLSSILAARVMILNK